MLLDVEHRDQRRGYKFLWHGFQPQDYVCIKAIIFVNTSLTFVVH